MYALHALGWSDFQQLCLTIAREILGQTVESFLDSSDGGRDGAFAGTWQSAQQEALTGAFVIQCKFTSKAGYNLRLSDLSDEVEKVQRLVDRGLCDSYVLMTNAGVSGERAADIRALFVSAGVKHFATFGGTWITQQIHENARLRRQVPRMYGLGDLTQILDERAYAQAGAILDAMREDLAKVVVTEAYQRAVDALNAHSFVLLIGEPAAGKTTIASLLAMAALDQWKAAMLKLEDPGKVVQHWNPAEPSQFFWLDDAFGVTQYEDGLVRQWNHMIPQIQPMLRKGAKIVMTSRDYIYNRARRDLKISAFPLINESQVVVDVHDLSADEKRQILYNHLKLGKQPRPFRTEIKPHLERIASHPRFIPEVARRLADPMFTRDLFVDPYYLDEFVEKREQLLEEVVQGLDSNSNAALGLIYMRNGRLESPIDLRPAEMEALTRLGSSLGGCVDSLEALKGSLVLFSHANGESAWHFKHPTIGDAYAADLVRNPEHLGIYILGTSVERLVEQVTCGDVGIERAIVIPKSLYPMVLNKLGNHCSSASHKTAGLSAWSAKREVQEFLAGRCAKEFISLYLEQDPSLLERVSKPGLYLGVVPEVRLARRLHELDLLPAGYRRKFVETVTNYAVEGEDAFALDNKGIRTLFTDDEFERLQHRVQQELIPRLDNVRDEWQSSYSSGEADGHMQQYLELLYALKKSFISDAHVVARIERQVEQVNDWITEHSTDESIEVPRRLGKVGPRESLNSSRSIFDDIDADESPDECAPTPSTG